MSPSAAANTFFSAVAAASKLLSPEIIKTQTRNPTGKASI
jgi:hypothetical protein